LPWLAAAQVVVKLKSREGKGHTHAEVVFGTAVIGQEVHRAVWRDVLRVLAYEIYSKDV